MCEALTLELEQALEALDRINTSTAAAADPNDDPKASHAQEEELKCLKRSLDEERAKSGSLEQSLSSLEALSGSVQQEVLKLDADKIHLHGLLSQSQEENGVLSKVLQKISKDHEELQHRFDKMMQV